MEECTGYVAVTLLFRGHRRRPLVLGDAPQAATCQVNEESVGASQRLATSWSHVSSMAAEPHASNIVQNDIGNYDVHVVGQVLLDGYLDPGMRSSLFSD